MADTLVLVTVCTGFIAQHCILALLEAGYRVRTTVRNLAREQEVRDHFKTGGIDAGDRLELVATDLGKDDGWAEAVKGCTYVMHGASPTPSGDQVTEEEWIRPAVDGNLRLLKAARDTGVKRVVLTSAFGAIGVGHPPMNRPFNEEDWSDVTADIAPYQKSKTLSERAAWDFIAREGGDLELAAINPVGVLGPALGPDYSHSIRLITDIMNGRAGHPRIYAAFVDVRDVADMHLRAMTNPAANGERFLAVSGDSMLMADVAKLLKERMGQAADKVSTRQLPDFVIKLLALNNKPLKNVVPLLGLDMKSTNEKAKRLLNWNPRTREESIIATAESLVRLGLLEK